MSDKTKLALAAISHMATAEDMPEERRNQLDTIVAEARRAQEELCARLAAAEERVNTIEADSAALLNKICGEYAAERDAALAKVARLTTAVQELQLQWSQQSEDAYCRMIDLARKPESLGWESKVRRGTFGQRELDAHRNGGELLGRHRGLAGAYRDIAALFAEGDTGE